MINLLKSNSPVTILLYLLYIALFRVVLLFNSIPDTSKNASDGPLYELAVSGWLQHLPVWPAISITLASALLLLQAWMVNRIANNFKFTARKNYVTGALYLIAASAFPQNLHLGPAMISLTLLLVLCNRLFSLVKKEKMNSDLFDTGFLLAIATLFHYPSGVFVVFLYIGLMIMRPFIVREWIIVLTGLISPFILLYTACFYLDLPLPLYVPAVPDFASIALHETPASIFITLWTLAGFAMMPGLLYSVVIQIRKYISILAIFSLFTLVCLLPETPFHLNNLLFLAFPVSITSAMVMVQIKRQWIPEVMHIILLLLTLAFQFIDANI